MDKHRVKTEGDALLYITDCNLATVCEMACKKSRPKGEFERQISIAQIGISWIVSFGISSTGTRIADVIKAGSVKAWAEQFMPQQKGNS